MMTNAKSLCLNMIVRNEMANLERCLKAVAPHIDCWVIGDTGSTDGTQDFIRGFFASQGIPGELHEFPFNDFAQARNEALDRARASSLGFDYLLFTDADMELVVEDAGFARDLSAAAYTVLQRSGVAYWNTRLLSRPAPAGYRGVTHEFLDVKAGETRNLDGVWFIDHATGSNRVEKYERDIRLLTEAIAAETDPGMIARYTFYLANTYKDSGQREAALDAYAERVRLGDWRQEVFVSLLNIAELKEELGRDDDEVVAAYVAASGECPTRAEALHGAARFCRNKGHYERGFDFATQGLAISYPKDALFVRDWIYDYGLLDELAVNAYWTGRYALCTAACGRLLTEGRLPAEARDRVLGNGKLADAKQKELEAAERNNDPSLALLRAARAKEQVGLPDEEVIGAYLEAAAANPARAEALHGAARFCRDRRLYERGYGFATRGLATRKPRRTPSSEAWIYDYGLLDELAINAYWTERYSECVKACDRLLRAGKLPLDQQERVGKNRDFAVSKRKEFDAQAEAGDDPFLRLLWEARRHEELGSPDDEVLAAFEAASAADPSRAEALHGAARYCRVRSQHQPAWEFAFRGLAIAKPSQAPGLEDWVYDYGLQEELSIAGNYACDPAIKDRAYAACNWLALNRSIPESPRNLALSNLEFYVQPAAMLTPSFTARQIEFSPPDGYRATNPSIARLGDELALVQRAVNYVIDKTIPDGDNRRYSTVGGEPINSRNFLLRLNDNLEILSSTEILPPEGMPEPVWPLAQGFEDLRPFAWRDGLWCIACVRELSADGWCEQALARIDQGAPNTARLVDWRVLRPEGAQRHEKNWMPWVDGDQLRFVYSCDPTTIVDDQARTVAESVPPIQVDQFRGGSQVIAFDGGWLALVHEARVRDGRRLYRHRWVWFDEPGSLRRVSRPFVFHQQGIEFAAGLVWNPDGMRLVVTYGVDDSSAWIATVDASDVLAVLEDVDHLRSGATEAPGPVRSNSDSIATTSPEIQAPAKSASASGPTASEPQTTGDFFRGLAPFLRQVGSPKDRREASRAFDAKIAPMLDCRDSAVLPQIHCFYEVLSERAGHQGLIAAMTSMRAAGHPVKLWTYSPEKLEFLRPLGVELSAAADVVPRGLYDKIIGRSEIRYFSDIFRYAVLYEHGGLWMDTDVVLLRPFPFRGDYFFNLQWYCGARGEHFVCGNIIFAKPSSRHLRALYEMSIEQLFGPDEWAFGGVGPKLLSDYIASEAGVELRESVFSPVFFNPIDWTEIDRFDRPLSELADYLNDERVFGVHLWTARNNPNGRAPDALISDLSDPERIPRLSDLADRFNTDKNRHTGNRHCYARVYDRLLSSRRLSVRRLMEVGLCRGLAEGNQTETPSVSLWQTYFPFTEVIGVDLTDFSALNNPRFKSFVGDQSKLDDLRAVAAQLDPGSFDVIIDDGSHASHDEQLTLREFFPLLADGGWYFIEDLDWQPHGEDRSRIALTKDLMRAIQRGAACTLDPFGVSALADQFAEILFFDSHYELVRANLMSGLVAIQKRGGTGLVR